MTVHDRCTDTRPHGPHRAQYGGFGVKDCPGVAAPAPKPTMTETDHGKPYTDADVETVADAIADARIRGIRNGPASMARVVLDALTVTGKAQMYSVESGNRDVLTGTLIDVAAAVGLEVALAAEHHLPLLELTAAEVAALVSAADRYADEWAVAAEDSSLPADQPDPHLLAALDKLRTEG